MNRLLALAIALAMPSLSLAAGKPRPAAAKPAAAKAATPAPPEAKPPALVAAVEGISEYRLENGLRVLLFPDPSKDTATVAVTYLVGSRHESYGETGMAHLLEHLLFKGSTKHPDVPKELTAHGARPNGSTNVDRTNYFESFSASDENLEWALDLEADRMVNSFVAKKDLDSEMTVVRNEFESGENEPSRVLMERVYSTAYLWHNYGKSTIGARSDIENVPIDRLQGFYRTWYQPDNAMLVVAGKIDPAKTLKLAAEKFGVIPRPARTLPPIYTAEPVQDGERFVTLRRVGETQAAMAAWHGPAAAHPDSAPLAALAFVLGDSPSGRLYKALVETKKATDVSCYFGRQHDPGLLVAFADAPKGWDVKDIQVSLARVAEEAVQKPPTAEEVERAKARLIKDWELSMKNSQGVALALSGWAAQGDWRLMFVHRDRLKALTAADVARVAATYLKSSNRTGGVFIPDEKPDRAEVPATPDVVALVKDYKGGEAMAEGEVFDPAPENVDARTVRGELPAGLKLAVIAKKTRGNMVHATVVLRFGEEKSVQGKGPVARLTGAMLMRGTKKHTRQQLRDEIDRLQARLNVVGSYAAASASLECPKDKLPEALRLVAEILREPSFPAEELELLRQQEITGEEEQKTNTGARANTTLERHLQPYPAGDPRLDTTPEEEIAALRKVTLDEVKRFHEGFYGASAGELSAVGEVDPGAIQKLAGELFGGWKSKAGYVRLVNKYFAAAQKREAIQLADKANANLTGGVTLDMRDDDPDYPAMVLGSFMTGGGFLSSRLATRIRQKEGLSYGVGAYFSASPFDKEARFGVYAIYAPQNDARLLTAFDEELAKVLAGGFTAEEVAAAKKGWLQSRRMLRSSEPELVRGLSFHLYTGRTYAWDGELEKKVGALGPEEIQAAMKRHLDLSRLSLVRAGDFANAKPKAAAADKASGGSGGR